jgi:hypothetical protein
MSNNKQSSVDELCNSFYEESIDESNIPREHYEYEIKQLMIEFALYYKQTYKKDMMTNDKQSSVLWLVSKIDFMLPTYLIEQAKAMHKEEIENSFVECWKANMPDGYECKLSAKEYYNETFQK